MKMENSKQREMDKRYLRIANIWSTNSYAIRLQVGCIIVSKEGSIISDGYNGTPSGFENVCEYVKYDSLQSLLDSDGTDEQKRIRLRNWHKQGYPDLISKPYVLHAEANAITKLAKSTQSSDGATLYVTHAPCIECSKLIIQAGIVRVVYMNNYKDDEGIALLQRARIKVENIPEEDVFPYNYS